ncbi:hypothetical protein ACI6PS_06055 [Flavobacterium sp. PLA-1-15]|uniref:hypothetical protein n=1 Tax=Flavobacterium sp. PLA-1-15 TaxID=3380533 RepID=UPI003B77F1B6
MKVTFKINKTLTPSEEIEMQGFVSSLEQHYAADINREERTFYTLFNFSTTWMNYQKILHFIQQIGKGKPYLTVL